MDNQTAAPILGVMLDLDGVLWKADQPLLDIQALFNLIRDSGKQAICLTNNSTRSRESYLDKLRGFGVDISQDWILTSAVGTARFLKQNFSGGEKVFVVGEFGLEDEIRQAGFRLAEGGDLDPVKAVVVGLDRKLNYQKISRAARYIRQGAVFLGTNPDPAIPIPTGIAPGAGAVIAAVASAAGTQPKIIGKPEPFLFQLALSRLNLHPENVLMVGDRLETDILGAQKAGLQSGLVLSGVASQDEAEAWHPRPDYTAQNALVLLNGLKFHVK